MKRVWPFPGEVTIIRARKVALAYREAARQQHEAIKTLREALTKADTRLLAYDSPATLNAVKDAIKALGDGDPVAELDQRFTDWGETWHCEQPQHYEMDDYVKAKEAAKLIHVSAKTIQTLRMDGRLKGHWTTDIGTAGGYLYLVADVYKLSSTMRTRGWRTKGSADNLNDSRRSDAK